ncbi:MAG: ABC transporter ATP-binding protein [Hungatella sp.]|nr:ABC transporter ATP-binding protein [Hungatella sp.]
MTMNEILKISNLKVKYGNIRALKGIDMIVERGKIVTLIGANGAGKSTTMNTIAGVIKAGGGRIVFDGQDITNKPSDLIVRKRIILSPEGRQVFPYMTVTENLKLGAITVKDKGKNGESLQMAYELFPILKEREHQMAGTLSGGEQQMLAIGRSLMSKPELLMLDEPSLGLAPMVVREIFRLIRRINEMGTTILLVEQNAKMALSISDYGYVLETGTIMMEGEAAQLLKNPKVKEVFLGG